MALDSQGRPSFQLLQNSLSQSLPTYCYAFDLLHRNGELFVNLPFSRRRELLESLLTAAEDPLRLSPLLRGSSGDVLEAVRKLGPLAAQRQVDLLKAQVEDARTQGATIVTGGREPPGFKGAYYEPTLITGVKPSMRVWKEEVFGPVLPVVSCKTEDEAIRSPTTPSTASAVIFIPPAVRGQKSSHR